MSEPDPKLLNLESALAETRRLREENARLHRLLQGHGIQIPGFPFTDGIPVATSAPSGARTPVLNREQRIALFRDLFHGRDDVYAVRSENTDGRFGYMPKADRERNHFSAVKKPCIGARRLEAYSRLMAQLTEIDRIMILES